MDTHSIKIMVVDDDPFVRELLSTILEGSGYGIVTAENGLDALEKYRNDPTIDLIVSDVNMPEMDGIQLIKTLREQHLDVPIIMVTSVSSISVAVDALSSGAIDYVLKDEGIQETINITVKRALEKHQLKLQNIQLLADLAAKTSEQEDTLSYLTAIINNMPDGLLVTNAQSRITLANPAIVKMFGLPDTNLVGWDCDELFKDKFQEMQQHFCAMAETPITTSVELTGGRIGSAVGAVIRKKQTASGKTEERIGNLVIVRDVTSEKEIDRMKDDFISTVSHELRTPLTSVLGFTRVIRKKLEEVIFPLLPTGDPKLERTVSQVLESIRVIVLEGERLTNLINDVLDLSKMEAGKIEWKCEPVNVEELLDRSTDATAALFDQKGVELIKVIAEDLPIVHCDKDRIIQVGINLLSNAVKFTDHGTVIIRAERATGVPEAVKISVLDTGIGISEEDRRQVFEKFRQVGDTLTDRPKGTGLGLPICKQIVEYHGGTIQVDARHGGGSIFSFVLPSAQPDQHTRQNSLPQE